MKKAVSGEHSFLEEMFYALQVITKKTLLINVVVNK